jgi:hypothetical protein
MKLTEQRNECNKIIKANWLPLISYQVFIQSKLIYEEKCITLFTRWWKRNWSWRKMKLSDSDILRFNNMIKEWYERQYIMNRFDIWETTYYRLKNNIWQKKS